MKHLLLLSVLLSLVLAINGGEVANAQGGQRLSATPRAFQVFYAKFRKAVVARDKRTVATLTRFPFKYAFDAGDSGTFSRSQFLKKFNDFLGGEVAIFERRSPTFFSERGTFELVDESDASHYIFKKRGATYQFTAYLSEP